MGEDHPPERGGPTSARARIATLLGSLVLVCAACDSGSPSEPQSQAGSSVVILDPDGLLALYHESIRSLLEETVVRASSVLAVGEVTITVTPDAGRSIPGWGLGGYAPGGSAIEIVIDPDYPGLAGILPERLPPVGAHELHHAARWRGPGYGSTLLEIMVSEGLSDHFAIELLGSPVPPWSDAFPRHRTDFYLDLARPELDSPAFDFGAWFFGTDPELPQWTGYTLGFRLVEAYQDRNPGRSAAQLVDVPAGAFRPD